MGVLRILLALAVFIGHTSPLFGIQLIGAQIAVQAFYMISGYYMFMILSEKYRGPGSTAAFLRGRFLRLFPAYAVIAGLALLTMLLFHNDMFHAWLALLPTLRPWTIIALVVPQITLIGQDILLFFSIDPVSGTLVPGTTGALGTNELLLLPTAWTLSVELWFYLTAPFLARRGTRTVLAVFAASLLLRLLLGFGLGLTHDPWSYRFFPMELALFLAGGLAYRASVTWLKPALTVPFLPQAAWAATIAGVVALPLLMESLLPRALLSFAFLFIALPFVFHATRRSRLDRFIGDLAYPVYLSHLLFLDLNKQFYLDWTPVQILPYVIGFSVLLVLLLEAPIHAWRQRLAGQAQRVFLPWLRLTGFVTGMAALTAFLVTVSTHKIDNREIMAKRIIKWAATEPNHGKQYIEIDGIWYSPDTIADVVKDQSRDNAHRRERVIEVMTLLENHYRESLQAQTANP